MAPPPPPAALRAARQDPRREARRQGGFTLLEVLVAMAILALSMGVLLKVFTGALTNAEVADGAGRAAALAESLMAGAGTDHPLEDGGASGKLDDGTVWRLTITARPDANGIDQPFVMYDVESRVTWQAAGRQRDTVLHSLRLGAREP